MPSTKLKFESKKIKTKMSPINWLQRKKQIQQNDQNYMKRKIEKNLPTTNKDNRNETGKP